MTALVLTTGWSVAGGLSSVIFIATTIAAVSRRATKAVERHIEETATEVAAQINLAIIERVAAFEQRVRDVMRRNGMKV